MLRRRLLVPVLLLPLVVSTACSGGSDSSSGDGSQTPAQVVEAARKTFDETSGVSIHLHTDELPRGVNGLTDADGQAAHPAAFTGTFDLTVSGFPAQAEVIAVDGKTYAKQALLLPEFTEIDPAKYGAPDPTELFTPDKGFSGLLAAVTDVKKGGATRGGKDNKEVLTSYTASVPGDAVTGILPTATGDFDVVLLITDDGELREIDATGEFYGGSDPLTYEIELDDYGSSPDISAP